MPRAVLLPCLAAAAQACSFFMMNYSSPEYRISARTEDMTYSVPDVIDAYPRGRTARPPNSTVWVAKYGFVGFRGATDRFVEDPRDDIYDGLNEAGLGCSSLTIDGAAYPRGPSEDRSLSLAAPYFCRWALENFADVEEAARALAPMTVFVDSFFDKFKEHFYLADEHGHGLAVEWVGGKMQLTRDLNDGGDTGFGIMTNAPTFAWQVENVRHYHWKLNTNPEGRAVPVPGGFYPDDRFLRIHVLKSAVEARARPTTQREAVTRAVSVLNSVQVPPGTPPATDIALDHTKWAVVKNHRHRQVFFRALNSPSLQLIDLKTLDLEPGAPVVTLSTELPDAIPWYQDVSSQFAKPPQRGDLLV